MSTAIAVASGPVSFFTGSGTQVSIPIAALLFDAGKIKLSDTYGGPNPAGLQGWLNYLASAGVIVPGKTAPPAAAIVFTAAAAGSTGNDVQVEIAYTSASAYTIKADKIDIYPGLTPASIGAVLGTSAALGSRPGLVRVADASSFIAPQDGTHPLLGGDAATRASALIDFAAGNTLTLEASSVGADGNSINLVFSNSDATAHTFTLTASWSKTVTIDATLDGAAQVAAIAAGLGFVLTAAVPSGGFSLPQAGSFTLSGGSDSAAASSASATALSNS